MLQSPIAVLGAGAWGTALALVLERNGNAVRLWSFDAKQVSQMRAMRLNDDFLPGFEIPDSIELFDDLKACVKDVKDVLVVVPSFAFPKVLKTIKKEKSVVQRRIAWGTKGVDADNGRLLSDAAKDILGNHTSLAVLSGPSFAKEVARKMPTALSLAGNDEDFLNDLTVRFHSNYFRIYRNDDMAGVQLCGVAKNIIAIAVGMADGLGFGANTQAALITRSLVEISNLCVALGGKQETLLCLAGVGDLVLTCTDNQSRNRRFGLALGKGDDVLAAKKSVGAEVEGYNNVKQVYKLAEKLGINMPITERVYRILFDSLSPKQAVFELLDRAPKREG